MISSRTYVGAGGLSSTTINLEANQIYDFKTYSGALFLISQSGYVSMAVLSSDETSKGTELTPANSSIKFFKKDTRYMINIYSDETGWHIQNANDSRRTIVLRIVEIKSIWN